MHLGVGLYFRELTERIGDGWNRFWYLPRDPLSLCALRLATGLLAVAWFWQVGQNFQFLFGEQGLLPYDKIVEQRKFSVFSIFDWVHDDGTLTLVFWVGLAVLIANAAGLFSRITSILSFLLVVSVLQRKPMLTSPVEDVLAAVMFYLCFAPTGATLSLDAWLKVKGGFAQKLTPSYAATIVTRLLQIHITAIYVLMTIAKLRALVWSQGMAIWWLAARADSRLMDLTGLHEYTINLWTLGQLAFEATFPIFVWNHWTRPLVLGVSVIMWLALCLVTGQVLFSLLMIAVGLAFVSPAWLRRITS